MTTWKGLKTFNKMNIKEFHTEMYKYQQVVSCPLDRAAPVAQDHSPAVTTDTFSELFVPTFILKSIPISLHFLK
jgi:hypothetical protein